MQNNTFSGLFVGHNLITLKEVDSTNTFLKDAVSKSAPLMDGTVIMADRQFAGRGQAANSWQSEAGKNLTFSILLRPSFLSVEQQFDLNKAISIAINDVLSKYIGSGVFIKWPNDIYINTKKIGGILIENIIQGTKIKHAIIGIGLNVNQVNFADSLKNVTSLKQELHHDYHLMGLLGEICSAVEARYLQLKAGLSKKISEDYLNRIYLMYHNASFKFNGTIKEGKIIGITETGQLVLETEGTVKFFNNKEIEFIIE